MSASSRPKKHDFIVVGKDNCGYTRRSVALLKEKKASFIYHLLHNLSPDNFEKLNCEQLFAANLMMKGKAQFYKKVPMIFVKDEKTEKYKFLERGSEQLFEMFGEK